MRECDLIMKGGVSSGVAYPGAVRRLSKHYRFRSIGGTSAGAIAAVLAGAAEYRRQRATTSEDGDAGFDALDGLGRELGRDLKTLFQPEPALAPLFDVLLAVATAPAGRSRVLVGLKATIRACALLILVAALPGLLLLIAGSGAGDVAMVVLGVVLGLLLPTLAVLLRAWLSISRDLPRNGYGICTGLTTQQGRDNGTLAFIDWVHVRIEAIAGTRDPARADGAPLTLGDLQTCGIEVASVTTDLSTRRPWRLPLRAGVHAFSVADFRKIMPRDVLDWLLERGEAIVHDEPTLPDDLHRLPDGGDMPLILLARLSLSFPGLISAVPLYREDLGVRADAMSTQVPWRRCLFSDGGISSNFPIHFFDAFLPSRPTFGIAFATHDETRHGADEEASVNLPKRPPAILETAVYPIDGIGGFLASIVTTAKDWQDTLQSQLAGYAERIVEIRLDPDSEGGLHVNMSSETIDGLIMHGVQAADALVKEFDFDEHRYRRALTLLPRIDEALERMAKNYRQGDNDPETLSYDDILTSYPPELYRNDSAWREDPLAQLARALVDIGKDAQARRESPDRRDFADGKLPLAETDMRLVASADVPAMNMPT